MCDSSPASRRADGDGRLRSGPVVTLAIDQTRRSDGSCGEHRQVITRTWTATDACGNTHEPEPDDHGQRHDGAGDGERAGGMHDRVHGGRVERGDGDGDGHCDTAAA